MVTCGIEGTKEDISSPFSLVRAVGEGENRFGEKGGFLERESPTSL